MVSYKINTYIIFRIEENSIALPITDKKHDKREIIPHADDWDDVGISMISEISEISEVGICRLFAAYAMIDINLNTSLL